MNETRINARLDQQTADDLQFLREQLGFTSITEVLKYSLQQAAQDLRDRTRARQQKQLWRDSGLMGVMQNEPENLSVDYKQHVAEYLDKKYSPNVAKNDVGKK